MTIDGECDVSVLRPGQRSRCQAGRAGQPCQADTSRDAAHDELDRGVDVGEVDLVRV